MKTKLTIALLMTISLICSCRFNCRDIVKPTDLKPIDWNGWNDAYTVGYTYYDNEQDINYDHNGDTIRCYGHIARYLYEDYPSLNTNSVYLEAGEKSDGVRIFFDLSGSERGSLRRMLDSSSHSDTCFAKGILMLTPKRYHGCYIVYCPDIHVSRLEDIYFK